MQQGWEIPPAIGPNRIDALKVMVLDLDLDRSEVPGEAGNLAFFEPIGDELRAIIFRAFFRWCEQLGIAANQTRDPNTPYSNSFPFGGCHPYFPMDDAEGQSLFIDVLEIPLTVQDLNRQCFVHLGRLLADQVMRHHGIAHYLFHPAHTSDDDVRGGLRDIVGYLKDKDMPWMRAAEINQRERRRRGVSFDLEKPDWRVVSNEDLEHATILIGPTDGGTVERYGFRFHTRVMDLKAEEWAGILFVRT